MIGNHPAYERAIKRLAVACHDLQIDVEIAHGVTGITADDTKFGNPLLFGGPEVMLKDRQPRVSEDVSRRSLFIDEVRKPPVA